MRNMSKIMSRTMRNISKSKKTLKNLMPLESQECRVVHHQRHCPGRRQRQHLHGLRDHRAAAKASTGAGAAGAVAEDEGRGEEQRGGEVQGLGWPWPFDPPEQLWTRPSRRDLEV